MRENRTSGSEGGEAQTNELSLPLSLCWLPHFAGSHTVPGCQTVAEWDDPPWSEQGHFNVGGPSMVRTVRRMEAAPTLCRLGGPLKTQASSLLTISPWTSVRRKSRP